MRIWRCNFHGLVVPFDEDELICPIATYSYGRCGDFLVEPGWCDYEGCMDRGWHHVARSNPPFPIELCDLHYAMETVEPGDTMFAGYLFWVSLERESLLYCPVHGPVAHQPALRPTCSAGLNTRDGACGQTLERRPHPAFVGEREAWRRALSGANGGADT